VQSSTKMGANLKGGRVFFHLTHTPPHTIKVRYRSCGSGFASDQHHFDGAESNLFYRKIHMLNFCKFLL
jgi:hypothetical protein